MLYNAENQVDPLELGDVIDWVTVKVTLSTKGRFMVITTPIEERSPSGPDM